MKTSTPHSKKSEQVRDAYDGTAEFYDSRYKHIQYLKYGILLPKLIDSNSLPQISLPEPLLDNGGGTGLFLDFLQDLSLFIANKKGTDEEISYILDFTCYLINQKFGTDVNSISLPSTIISDISFEMLRVARKFHTTNMCYGLVACNSSHLPFRTSQFSTLTAFTVFQNIDDIENAIAESSRVLNEEGILGMSVLEKSRNKLKFANLLGSNFHEINPVYFEEERVKFQKTIVQLDKYSQLYDLAKVEDFFLAAKKTRMNEQ